MADNTGAEWVQCHPLVLAWYREQFSIRANDNVGVAVMLPAPPFRSRARVETFLDLEACGAPILWAGCCSSRDTWGV